MSCSWPWMRGVDVPLVDKPIDPIDSHDERPAVKDLLEQNRSTVDKIRVGVSGDPLYDPTKHDDLWLLRFALSHKKSKPAIEAAKACLEFRKNYNLDEKDIRDRVLHKEKDGPCKRYIDACGECAAMYTIPHPQRGVVAFMYISKLDQPRLLAELSEEDLLLAFIHVSEFTFQNLDFITRTTGRLTKNIRLADLEGFTMKKFSMEQNRREGEVMGLMDNCYPQLLDKVLIINAPAWIQVPWRILRPIMPKRVVSKMDFSNPKDNAKERNRLLKSISEDKLPVKYGRKNEVSPYEW